MKTKSKEVLDYLKAVFIEYENNENKLKTANQQLDATNQQLQASELQLKSANQKLLEQTRELSLMATVVADSNDAVTIQDLEGNIVAWNAGAIKMYGYTEEEALRLNVADFVPDNHSVKVLDYLTAIKNGKPKESLETKRKTKEGKIVDVWLVITKLVDENGQLTGIATTERDITERNRAMEEIKAANQQLDAMNQQLLANEQQLRAINQQLDVSNQQLLASEIQLKAANQKLLEQTRELLRLATVVAVSDDAIITRDLDGNITSWNAGATKMYGYSQEEALQMKWIDLVHEDFELLAFDIIDRLKNNEQIESLETKRVSKDGNVLDVWIVVTRLVDENGILIGAASTERDITYRKQIENELFVYHEQLEQLVEKRSRELKDEIAVRKLAEVELKAANQQLFAANQQLHANNQQLIESESKQKDLFEKLLEKALKSKFKTNNWWLPIKRPPNQTA